MKKRIVIACIAVTTVLIGSALAVWKVSAVSAAERRIAYQNLCKSNPSHNPNVNWHLLVYMDIHACLTCNEDMDAWRELASSLANSDGELLIWAPREDSVDVAWAMELEGITQYVRVAEPQALSELGWSSLGTPVKVLLDSLYQPVEIAGWLDSARESKWFIERVLAHIQS